MSTKDENNIHIMPDQVEFVYDSFGVSQAEISITNNMKNWIAFKILTNAEKFYIVEQTTGQIPPLESLTINISAKWDYFKTSNDNELLLDPDKVNHKFQIQTIKCSTPLTNIPEVFKDKSVPKDKVILSVIFIKRSDVNFDLIPEDQQNGRVDDENNHSQNTPVIETEGNDENYENIKEQYDSQEKDNSNNSNVDKEIEKTLNTNEMIQEELKLLTEKRVLIFNIQ